MKDGGKLVNITDPGFEKTKLLDSGDYEDHFDPHVWFEVPLWKETIDVVVAGLSKADPDHKADYEANGKAPRKRWRICKLGHGKGERIAR